VKVTLQGISISFYQKRILKNIDFVFEEQGTYAITGGNGSGKSTVVKLLAGVLKASQGQLSHSLNTSMVSPEHLYKHLNWVAPYINIYEELNAVETFNFQKNFKNTSLSLEDFLLKTNLVEHRNKRIKYYSSGMKQRLKLALGMFFACDLLLLDEPTMNLDKNFQGWYLQNLEDLIKNGDKTIIIASNAPEEYTLAQEVLDLEKHRS
jgi:ABC-type multidrug transport system ATPase subunit